MRSSKKPHLRRVARKFLKLGTCSRTLFYILNREFVQPRELEERAIDPLAGGILQHGYQCGMLWGASMAIGAESYRRTKNLEQATGLAIKATQHIMESFKKRTKSADCYDITQCDFHKKKSMFKYFFTGKAISCFTLARKWAPEAVDAAYEGLSGEPEASLSCASEVIKKIGGNKEHQAMAAGLAGGLGLSGNACGALSAAIWINSMEWAKENPEKSPFSNPNATKTLEAFFQVSDYEFLCSKICGKQFNTPEEHSEFVKNGGCDKLMKALASPISN